MAVGQWCSGFLHHQANSSHVGYVKWELPCVPLGCFFNSLWPSGAIWWQRSESTLAQIMACCLTAPSHYLNHCWLIISKVQWHSISQEMPQPLITEICSKITCLKCHSNFPGANELTIWGGVWCGVVWCGVVWWSAVEWSGVEWREPEKTTPMVYKYSSHIYYDTQS